MTFIALSRRLHNEEYSMDTRQAQSMTAILRDEHADLPEPANDVPAWGPYITAHFNPRKGVELFYAEIHVPQAGAQRYIYWSLMNPNYGKNPSYAGIQMSLVPGNDVYGNNICSIWDSDDLPEDTLPEATLISGRPGIYWDHFGNEGTGLHTSNQNAWKPGERYAMVIRRWTRKGDDKYTYTSMFMYSFTAKTWTHWMSARIAGRALMLEGNPAGFVERYGGDAQHYYGHFGNYFIMVEGGEWQSPHKYTVGAGKAPWRASLVNGHSGQDVKVQVGQTPERDQEITLRPAQQNRPTTITPPIIESFTVTYHVRAQTIEWAWTIKDSSPPPIRTLLSISRDEVYGQDVYLHEINGPSGRKAITNDLLLRENDYKGTYRYFARIEYFDIFEQKSNNGYVQVVFDYA